MKLKDSIGRLVVKSLGVVLTPESSKEEIELAIKHEPIISKFVEQTKPKKDVKNKTTS